MSFELLACNTQAAVREARVLPESSQLVRQAALRYLHHVHGVLAGDVDRVLHHAHLEGNRKQTIPELSNSRCRSSSPSGKFSFPGRMKGNAEQTPQLSSRTTLQLITAYFVPHLNPVLCSSTVTSLKSHQQIFFSTPN